MIEVNSKHSTDNEKDMVTNTDIILVVSFKNS